MVYICSNSGIASQNITKLARGLADATVDTGDTRLSMQHLTIARQEIEAKEKGTYIRLIPVTPATSFQMTSGSGTGQERALMYAILRRIPELAVYTDEMSAIFRKNAEAAWDRWTRQRYEDLVIECEEKSQGKYPNNIIKKISTELKKNDELFLNEIIGAIQSGNWNKQYGILKRIRMMFASASVEMLEPNLVIMDEFQRFRSLLKYERGTETEMICRKMFAGNNAPNILLLSATPYKLYSTLEEIEESGTEQANTIPSSWTF